MPALRKYPYGLDEPLLFLNDHPWTIRDAMEGAAILGDMGSGKTTGSSRTIRKAFLNAGFGGLVMTKKTDEADSWIRDAHACGREDQLLIVHPHQPFRFNFLQYQFSRVGEGAGKVENAVQMFVNIIENRREGSSRSMGQNERFFTDGAKDLIRHSLEALILSEEEITMDNLRKIVRGLPYAGDKGAAFPENSFLDMILQRAITRYQQGWTINEIVDNTPRDVAMYFFNEFARPGANRQSAGILSTFTGMAQPFMGGPVKELFCTETNFIPEFSRKGAIIILNLALDEWEEIGRTAQLMFKYIWQKAVLRRQGLPPGEVPVFLWADEAQNFITTADAEFQGASRSSYCGTVFLSQNINNYHAAFAYNPEANANALLAGLGTKIFHRNGDSRTNTWASDTISRAIQIRYSGGDSTNTGTSYSDSWGVNWGTSSSSGGGGHSSGGSRGGSRGESTNYSRGRSESNNWSQQMDYQVQPETFTRLKAVGNIQAIVFKSGAEFAPHGLPFTGVSFKQ
jgi:hypothetical protein